MLLDADTIVAIATPTGRGGIGVVRLSGSRARAIVEPMLRLRRPRAHAQARFAAIVDEAGTVLDEAVVTYFAAPHSYTAEDVVEISAHGAPVLLDHLLRTSIHAGARLAEPGEFTQRAFLSGRLDLTQAEAVNDLIAAQTLHQARLAAAQLGGSIARAVAPIKHNLLTLIAGLEAGIDFAEDDLDLMPEAEIEQRLEAIRSPLAALARSFTYGRIVREGVKLAIVGQPNAGKSSLFNQLLERERAIVTAQPGTTRDPISEHLAVAGIPVELIDTAGLREVAATPEHEAERQGIARSRATLAEADLVLHVVDATTLNREELPAADLALRDGLAARPSILIVNKADLNPHASAQRDAIRTSALTGEGIATLRQAIAAQLGAQAAGDGALVSSLRQSEALRETVGRIDAAKLALSNAVPHEFLLLDLHAALQSLDSLTGTTAPDEILKRIFSSFCIGK